MSLPRSIQELSELLADQKYLADQGLATALFLALQMGRPLLLEGSPGVGKTEVAKALAGAFGKRLIRLQCYEGIDVSQALYEWDFARQMVAIRAAEIAATGPVSVSDQLFSRRFLLERPLLAALQAGSSAVLLIDEIDRADDEFEAFLLEFLAEFPDLKSNSRNARCIETALLLSLDRLSNPVSRKGNHPFACARGRGPACGKGSSGSRPNA